MAGMFSRMSRGSAQSSKNVSIATSASSWLRLTTQPAWKTILSASSRSAASSAPVMPASSRASPSAGERLPGAVGSTGLTPSS